jgi:aminoglycoside 6'-N-acetyltransferase
MAGDPYAFREMTADDLPMIARWLATPEVVEWWGDPDEQYTLVAGDLDNADMLQWIVSFEGRPFAYAQAYQVHVWPQPHFAHLLPGSMAIDAFTGEPDMIGAGHGGVFLRRLATRLRDGGAPVVAIDPDEDNLRARRAYARAGFVGDTLVETGEGPAVLMLFGG